MTTALDMTSFDAALKQHYTDDIVNNLVYQDHAFLALVPKNEKFGGKNLPIPLIYGNPMGRSADFASALAQKSSSKLAQFLITRQHDYALANIDNETIEASAGDSDAFMEASTTEIDGAYMASTRSLASALFRNGTGSIGVIGSISSAVATLASPADVVNFEVGMTLNVSATDGAAVRSGSVVLVGIDRDAGTLTASGNWTAGISAAVAGDYISVSGDLNAKIKGLDAWIPLAAPGSTAFFGVDRTADTTRLAGVRKSYVGVPIEEALIDMAAKIGREGGRPNYCSLSFENYASLEKALGSKVQYVELKSEVGIGFDGIKIMGPKGVINVVPDQDCQGDRFYMKTMKTWKLHSLGKAPKALKSDGLEFLRVSNADAVEVRVGYYAQLACNAPGWNGVGQLS